MASLLETEGHFSDFISPDDGSEIQNNIDGGIM